MHHHADRTILPNRVRQGEVKQIEPLLIDVLQNGHLVYHVSLTQRLWELKQRLIESAANAS